MELVPIAATLGVALLGAVAWGVLRVAAALGRSQARSANERALQLLTTFAPGLVAAQSDPTAILVWQPVAATARALFPDEFVLLDRAAGAPFPFSPDRIQDAHARWTADWLTWEQAHNGLFKLKVAEAQADLAQNGSTLARARLEAVEREKLDLYQARYGQYVRVSKALQALLPTQ